MEREIDREIERQTVSSEVYLVGTYTFLQVSLEQREKKQSCHIAEKPDEVKILYDGKEVEGDDIKPENSRDDLVVQCEVEGGGREVEVELLVDDVAVDADVDSCRASSRSVE